MGKQQAARDAGMAYIRAHPDQSDGQLAEVLEISRLTARMWRKAAGVPPRRYSTAVAGSSDETQTAGAEVEDQAPILTWNEAIAILAKYALGLQAHKDAGYVLDLPAEVAAVTKPGAYRTALPKIQAQLAIYERLLGER
jgi:hypothetical protein